MRIEFRHCNNIDHAIIELVEKKLNIKYAPNGTGKSTIAQALSYWISGEQENMNGLLPFKWRTQDSEGHTPEVDGADCLRSVMCFNEEYVAKFVFKPDELLTNSFEILLKTEEYTKNELEIEALVREIKETFSESESLSQLISDLQKMGEAFKQTKTGLSKASSGMKGLSRGNRLQHIPLGLEPYKPFIQSDKSVSWIDWQVKGCDFSHLSDDCPFCSSSALDKKETIEKVGKEYDKNLIKNLISILEVLDGLGKYFSPDAAETLKGISNLSGGVERVHEDFLLSVKTQVDTFTDKLLELRSINAFKFSEDDKVAEKLSRLKFDLKLSPALNSEEMQSAIGPLNDAITEVAKQAGLLQGKLNQQRRTIKNTIERHQDAINGFLQCAGYRYKVEIVGEGERAQLKLRHLDHREHVVGGSQHLSFGERNAFAIVLFMCECLSKKPDLIVLDDPISSFDSHKKYAILEMLFRKDAAMCLKGRTVLMLTHDVEPIIDTTKSLASKFSNLTTSSFLQMKAGQMIEIAISRSDIQTFSQICRQILTSDKDVFVKAIYLRRELEILDERGDAYQVLSNLFKLRERAVDFRESPVDDAPEMDREKFLAGCSEIRTRISGFDYASLVLRASDTANLKALFHACTNGYEKLQIFRMFNVPVTNPVVKKFIDETYHIENEFVCQLDPTKFDCIPEHIVAECSRMVDSIV